MTRWRPSRRAWAAAVTAALLVATLLAALAVLRHELRTPSCGFGCPVSSISEAPGP